MSEPGALVSEQQKEELLQRAADEARRFDAEFSLPIVLDIQAALAIAGNLQLALRHPSNKGPSSRIARAVVDGIIRRLQEAGFEATAEIVKLGDNPAYDTPPEDHHS